MAKKKLEKYSGKRRARLYEALRAGYLNNSSDFEFTCSLDVINRDKNIIIHFDKSNLIHGKIGPAVHDVDDDMLNVRWYWHGFHCRSVKEWFNLALEWGRLHHAEETYLMIKYGLLDV